MTEQHVWVPCILPDLIFLDDCLDVKRTDGSLASLLDWIGDRHYFVLGDKV